MGIARGGSSPLVRIEDGGYRRFVSEDRRTRRGYLLLADISGYTAFLAGTELEHASAIVHELTTLIRERPKSVRP